MSDGARRRFAHARRREHRLSPWQRIVLAEQVCEDARFRSMKPTHRLVLLVGILKYANADGRFWPKLKTWAAAVGVSRATVTRAAAAAEAVGLITREAQARPDGFQDSTSYWLDPALTRWLTVESPCPTTEANDDATRRLNVESPCEPPEAQAEPTPATRWLNSESPPRRLNSEPPEQIELQKGIDEERREDSAVGEGTYLAETERFLAKLDQLASPSIGEAVERARRAAEGRQ